MALEELIEQWRWENPEDGSEDIIIDFRDFRNDHDVVAVAQAFQRNTTIDKIGVSMDDEDILPLNWDPLLDELATRENLKEVSIYGAPREGGPLFRLFRDHLFQALQRNLNFSSLQLLCDFHHTNGFHLTSSNSVGFVSFLDDPPPALTVLTLEVWNVDNSDTGRRVAVALQRNSRIRTLNLLDTDANFLCTLFQSLASNMNSASPLSKLSCRWRNWVADHWATVAESLQEYLESPSATIQCLELQYLDGLGASHILRGIHRNTTIHELSFDCCNLSCQDQNNLSQREILQQLVDLVRDWHKLSTLKVMECNFFHFEQFSNAFEEVLLRRNSALRRLEFSLDAHEVPIAVLQSLLTAVSNCTRLEHLLVCWSDRSDCHLLANAIPTFKVHELSLVFFFDFDHERVLEALKRNYTVQTITCEDQTNDNWFNDAEQAHLDFYLNRNKKLAEWTENPKMVPRELWSYAINLALEAGINTLFQSLIALSGQGVGLKQKGRKRKRPQNYDPSSEH